MQETYEFRVSADDMALAFGPGVGRALGRGAVRLVEAASSDPVFRRIGELDQAAEASGSAFFTSWRVKRVYSNEELSGAELMRLKVQRPFEQAGDDHGTQYDDTDLCPICGTGRRQVSDLVLDVRRIPAGKDIASTLSEEVIVSARFAEAVQAHGLSGIDLRPVLDARSASATAGWHQLIVASRRVHAVPPTQFGIHPFDDDPVGEYRCPLGHVAGLNILSELSVERDSWDGSDFVATRELVGVRRGDLMPAPILAVSQRAYAALRDARIKGVRWEVVHLK